MGSPWDLKRCGEEEREKFRVLELFSGLGGFHFALKRALPGVAAHVESADINTNANQCYEANFGVQPHVLNLEQLSAADLDEYDADLWCLSPPCQPFTTTVNARRQDAADPRSRALLSLCDALRQMSRPPRWMIMENVAGFLGSESHGILLEALRAAGFTCLQEYVVSPHQLGFPYLRPRYFALASRYEFASGPTYHGSSHMDGGQLLGQGATGAGVAPSSGHQAGPWSHVVLSHPPALHPADVEAVMGERLRRLLRPLPVTRKLRGCDGTQDQKAGSDLGDEERHQRQQSIDGVMHMLARAWELRTFKSSNNEGNGQNLGGSNAGSIPCSNGNGSMTGSGTASAPSPLWPDGNPPGSTPISSFASGCLPLGMFLHHGGDLHAGSSAEALALWEAYALPPALLSKFYRVFDIVTATSQHSNCVTKNYGRQVIAAGSILATHSFVEGPCCIRDDRGRMHLEYHPSLLSPGAAEGAAAGEEARDRAAPASGASAAESEDTDSSNVASDSSNAGSDSSSTASSECISVDGRPGAMPSAFKQGAHADASDRPLSATTALPRYLSPDEIANIHGLPPTLPATVHAPKSGAQGDNFHHGGLPDRTMWQLLGNSLSVDVAAWLLRHMLAGALLGDARK